MNLASGKSTRVAPILVGLWLLLGFLNLGAPAQTAPASHADAFTKDGLVKANVANLPDTKMVAYPDAPLPPDTNVLWCDTLQLAWNAAIGLVGESLHFANAPPEVALLNRQDFTTADIDKGSYVALADFERNHVEDEIRTVLQYVFHGAASPELIPEPERNPGPDDFVAYAYLFKNLQFATPFIDQKDPLEFGDHPVKNFGFRPSNHAAEAMREQVEICDYQSPDDFVIRLKTKVPEDELILAKITPGETLQATMASVLQRVADGRNIPQSWDDELAVPKLNVDLLSKYPELTGLVLTPSPTAKVGKLITALVEQKIRFQLNENGAVLKSEAVIMMPTGVAMPPANRHEMIFDKPFLILMKRAEAKQPYFALWVGNASLLTPAPPEASP